ncbi:MAG TPA: hypothetical protein VHQ65_12650 [Thermoanaerobaculia bacterium]|nr:hypothetical protein [Thermoanaerobaculia bacterium]
MIGDVQGAATLAGAAALAAVHLFGGRLRFLRVVPRSRWLSAAGGASVAYVFVHLFPELAAAQETFGAAAGASLAFLEHHVYLVSLAGLVAFYALERVARRHSRGRQDDGGTQEVETDARRRAPAGDGRAGGGAAERGPGVFWVHVGSFALYNALVGYLLLHREGAGLESLALYTLAMALHFLVNDHGLSDHHRHLYERRGRWILAVAVLAGWLAGATVPVHRGVVAALFAWLAGGVVLNVIKEELPAERDSRLSAFVAGAAGYAALLVLAAG